MRAGGREGGSSPDSLPTKDRETKPEAVKCPAPDPVGWLPEFSPSARPHGGQGSWTQRSEGQGIGLAAGTDR